MFTLDETKFIGFFIMHGAPVCFLDGSRRLERLNAIGVPYVVTEVRYRKRTGGVSNSIIAALVSPDDAVVVKLLNSPIRDPVCDFADIREEVDLTRGATFEFDPNLVYWDPTAFKNS